MWIKLMSKTFTIINIWHWKFYKFIVFIDIILSLPLHFADFVWPFIRRFILSFYVVVFFVFYMYLCCLCKPSIRTVAHLFPFKFSIQNVLIYFWYISCSLHVPPSSPSICLTHWGRLGSFKLFKRPFQGFLTILTL